MKHTITKLMHGTLKAMAKEPASWPGSIGDRTQCALQRLGMVIWLGGDHWAITPAGRHYLSTAERTPKPSSPPWATAAEIIQATAAEIIPAALRRKAELLDAIMAQYFDPELSTASEMGQHYPVWRDDCSIEDAIQALPNGAELIATLNAYYPLGRKADSPDEVRRARK